MWIENILLAVFGLAAGAGLAGGFFALIIALGIISGFAERTRTGRYVLWYENMVMLGACFGTFWYLFEWRIPFGTAALAVYGSFAGIFLGGWTMALTEVIDSIPIFMRRIQLKKGLGALVLGLALGHTAGSLLYYYLWR